MRRPVFALALLLASVLSGCGETRPPGRLTGPSMVSDEPPAPAVPPSFELACEAGPVTIDTPPWPGVACTIMPRDGFQGSVTLSCSNEPAYVECGFEPGQLEIGAPGPRTATFHFRRMNLRAEPGTFTVNATAKSDALLRSAEVTVTVAARCAGFKSEASFSDCVARRLPGTTCARFSDGYIWLVRRGGVLGWTDTVCDGRKVEIVMTGVRDVGHVLGTDLVRP